MALSLPSPIESLSWDDIPEIDRDFFCFEDAYLPLPETHRRQIFCLSKTSAERLDQWLAASLPLGSSRDNLAYPCSECLSLDDSSWNTENGRNVVRQWLHNRGVPYATTVYLFYDRDCVISLPWKLVVKYWDAFAWSVGYAMIAADHTAQWACLFHHENVIQFATFPQA